MEEVFLKVKDESDEDVESRVQGKGSLRPNRDALPVEPHQDTPAPAPGIHSLFPASMFSPFLARNYIIISQLSMWGW